LKFVLPAILVIAMFSVTSCTKKTTNNNVVQDSIYYSAWIPLSMQVDVTDSIYEQSITASKLTASVISHGAVLGYLGYPGNSDTIVESLAELSSLYGVQQILEPGTISIITPYEPSFSCCDLTYTASSGFLYRYVIIPGNVLTTSFNGMTQQQLSKMSFSDVQKAINASKQASGNTFNP
jgi:hypothetical protein